MKDECLIRHEKIHLEQQKEMLVIPFYICYTLEYFIKILKYKSHYKAYKNISFEKEAHLNDMTKNYLNQRKRYAFLKYY